MSERILRALMQLFAIIAKVDEVPEDDHDGPTVPIIQSTKGRNIIEGFLKSELSSSDVKRYLNIFEDFLNQTRGKLYTKKGGRKRTSLQAVKVLRICSQINEELTQRQKVIVLVRIFEFISSDHLRTEKELDFVKTAADAFNISKEEYEDLHLFIESDGKKLIDGENHLYYTKEPVDHLSISKHSEVDGLDAPIHIVNIKSVKALLFKYYGKDELLINGQIVSSSKTHLFSNGSTIRTAKSSQIYYSDLVSRASDINKGENLSFEVTNVIHKFGAGNLAIRKLNFATNGGTMIGIMGGSGTGKTTLMNIMNGKVKPTFGSVKINSISLHEDSGQLEGMIGNVAQSDLLIEELTVFQNLYFAAKLSMGGLSQHQLTHKVVSLLNTLGLYEIRTLRVGSPLEKVISGGQRKRLNIALELIREPQILFVDEPTSGLSSRDSENIMDLLKELSLRGTLVFVVIHQPSSNIFKLFDRLLIMDVGGHLIYDGIPLNALVHFKTYSYQGNAQERECSLCGNVNPEQIFNIIDAKVVDEYGIETATRKKSPEDWHKLYQDYEDPREVSIESVAPEVDTELPGKFQQFKTYLIRDFLSKVSNTQYLAVNGLVAPLLAMILAFFIKYFNIIGSEQEYSFYHNENIPQYIFMTIIVGIFLGLTVAAEEINKDKKILARERFLNLSRGSYLLSKLAILFAISGIQTLFFVTIGNFILEIKGMYLEYWLILFSTSFLSNLVGLNISSAFNSAKVIYIIVPLLIIPQLLFSGVIVQFDKLHPSVSNATKVPWIGNIMVSRWAYEALAVEQASNNQLEKHYFVQKMEQSQAKWKKDFWVPEIRKQMDIITRSKGDESKVVQHAENILVNEITKEDNYWGNLNCIDCIDSIQNGSLYSMSRFSKVNAFLDTITVQFNKTINDNNAQIQHVIDSIGLKNYAQIQKRYSNESLMNLVTNKMEEHKLIIDNDEIYQNDESIYNLPKEVSFLHSHFYAPQKYMFGQRVDTYWSNLIVIWVISIFTYIMLYFDWLRRIIEGTQHLFNRKKKA